jgi:hypothetical protein
MISRAVKWNRNPQNPSKFGQTNSVAGRKGNKVTEKYGVLERCFNKVIASNTPSPGQNIVKE